VYSTGAYAHRSWLHARHIACDMRFRFATVDVSHGGLTPPLMMHGPVAFRLLLTLFGAYLFESVSCLRAGSGCCLRCSEVNQA
jgi:hypothetical protein